MNQLLRELNFKLPHTLIAQRPASPRENARLLVYERKTNQIVDDYFHSLLNYLPSATTLVLNNSKVEKARLKFDKREIFLLKKLGPHTAEALVYPGTAFRPGVSVELTKQIKVEVVKLLDGGHRFLRFSCRLDDPLLGPHRQTPFPPYIRPDEDLANEYQTVYAKVSGSVAAPTAGLHFSDNFLKHVRAKLSVVQITLHVGLGTFAPLRQQNFTRATLHDEFYGITSGVAKRLNRADHITAVGTTTLRALESNVASDRHFRAGKFSTDIFIQPGYEFKAVDALITNFHLPKSSLLVLVAALVGVKETQRIYQHAIKQRYRFYSFGDAMLIL